MKIATALPRNTLVAVSGGPDSMMLLHYLSRVKSRVVGVINVQYSYQAYDKAQVEYSELARSTVENTCRRNNLNFIGLYDTFKSETEASSARRDVFDEYSKKFNCRVAVGHTLDDAFEWYLIRAFARQQIKIDGNTELMLAENGSVYRPLLFTSKSEVLRYCARHDIQYVNDPSNVGVTNLRAVIRKNNLVRSVLECFPMATHSFRRRLVDFNSNVVQRRTQLEVESGDTSFDKCRRSREN